MRTDVTVTVLDDLRIVRVAGEFDADETDALTERLALPPEGSGGTIVDLADVTFADSSLLHTLLTAQADHVRAGIPLVLVRLSPFVERLLDLTDTARAFRVAGGVPEAADLIRTDDAGVGP
ncbi:STAS domain-containing protein [Streptodolium elevatio]|uniref:STAS domain-containing protein n=1 Tax=Streptodolium elevatio TaxID=3157996 RepID=A0ABV3DP84_9ACTN